MVGATAASPTICEAEAPTTFEAFLEAEAPFEPEAPAIFAVAASWSSREVEASAGGVTEDTTLVEPAALGEMMSLSWSSREVEASPGRVTTETTLVDPTLVGDRRRRVY